ncbi:MAG TPA: OmpA family protein [Steroidobacteraceae bacterium]|nr:OmpA family protein [Steroidobacteraceae bacterium]
MKNTHSNPVKLWLLTGCAASALLAACASAPPEDPALIQAREAVAKLEADPLAQQQAGKPLQDARDALAQAEGAAKDKKKEETDHFAYIAKRKADLGEAMTDETRARQRIAQAQEQRNAVIIGNREREAQTARDQAAAAQAQAEMAQAQAKSADAQAAAAQKELADMQAQQTTRGIILTLGSNYLFDTNSDVLKPGAQDGINRVAGFLSEHQTVKVRIEGHTDSTGSDAYNQELSERRARSVARSLEDKGVDSSRIDAEGRGKDLPVATNATAEGRQQNRRVEIIFSDLKGQFGHSTM